MSGGTGAGVGGGVGSGMSGGDGSGMEGGSGNAGGTGCVPMTVVLPGAGAAATRAFGHTAPREPNRRIRPATQEAA
jgi:hypothetical protein